MGLLTGDRHRFQVVMLPNPIADGPVRVIERVALITQATSAIVSISLSVGMTIVTKSLFLFGELSRKSDSPTDRDPGFGT